MKPYRPTKDEISLLAVSIFSGMDGVGSLSLMIEYGEQERLTDLELKKPPHQRDFTSTIASYLSLLAAAESAKSGRFGPIYKVFFRQSFLAAAQVFLTSPKANTASLRMAARMRVRKLSEVNPDTD